MLRWMFILLLSTISLHAMGREGSFEFGLENYDWKEYDTDGSRLLAEFGQRYVLTYHSAKFTPLVSNLSRFYFGDVFYDGSLQHEDGSRTPYTSTTGYFGFSTESTWKKMAGDFTSEFSLGLDIWSRTLDKYGPYGYVETYTVFYSRFGIRHTAQQWTGRAGLKLPLLVDESVNGSFSLSPQPEPSFYTEIAYQHRQFQLTLYYDTYRFAASPPSGGYYQPTSTMDSFGILFSLLTD